MDIYTGDNIGTSCFLELYRHISVIPVTCATDDAYVTFKGLSMEREKSRFAREQSIRSRFSITKRLYHRCCVMVKKTKGPTRSSKKKKSIIL